MLSTELYLTTDVYYFLPRHPLLQASHTSYKSFQEKNG